MKLNLGAGSRRLDGYDSVDKFHRDADERVDLEEFPWPWQDATVDAVYMSHYLQQVHDVHLTVREVWRILKPGGVWEVEVPHKDSVTAYGITQFHRMGVGYLIDLGFCDDSWNSDYRLFKTVSLRLIFRKYCSYGPIRIMFPILEWAANFHIRKSNGPAFACKMWEYFHFPTDAMYWKGVKQITTK